MLNHLKIIALGGVPILIVALLMTVFPNLIMWLVILAAFGFVSWMLGVLINMLTGWVDDYF